MSVRRLRLGELLALAGAIVVIVALTRFWYQTPQGNVSAWHTFGPTIVLLLLAVVAALALALATLTERSTALPVAAGVWSTLFGIAATIAAIVRVFERPDHASALCAGAWLALAGAVLILLGSWQSMRDERTERYPPPDVQPREPPSA